jgi:hypothetical protein
MKNIWHSLKIWVKDNPQLAGLIAVLATWGSFFTYLWPRILYYSNDGIKAGFANVWGDWPIHFIYAKVFALRSPLEWFSTHPLHIEHKLSYPIAADAISGFLMRLGLNDISSFLIPSVATTIFLLVILYFFYSKVLNSAWQAFFAVTLFFANGGLGFWFYIQDALKDSTALSFPPREYTHIAAKGIEWINIVSSEMIPQRAFLLGLPLTLLIIYRLISWVEKDFHQVDWKKILGLGLSSGLLFIVHAHSLIALAIICAVYFAFTYAKLWKLWLIFAAGAALSALPLYWFLQHGQLSANFFRFHLGWMAQQSSRDFNYLFFVLLNWGLFIPLALLAIFKTKDFKKPLVVSGLIIFIACNLFIFQPWEWDNTKLITWSYLLLIIPVIRLLADFWKKEDGAFKPSVVLIFILLTASGFIDLYRLTKTEQTSATIWSNSDIAIAEQFKNISEPTDRVLSGDKHNYWINSLAGRQMVLGFRGWVWSQGLEYRTLESDVYKMFSGTAESLNLLQKYKIRFVVISPQEIVSFGAKEDFFSSRFPLVLQNQEYRVYQVY